MEIILSHNELIGRKEMVEKAGSGMKALAMITALNG